MTGRTTPEYALHHFLKTFNMIKLHKQMNMVCHQAIMINFKFVLLFHSFKQLQIELIVFCFTKQSLSIIPSSHHMINPCFRQFPRFSGHKKTLLFWRVNRIDRSSARLKPYWLRSAAALIRLLHLSSKDQATHWVIILIGIFGHSSSNFQTRPRENRY